MSSQGVDGMSNNDNGDGASSASSSLLPQDPSSSSGGDAPNNGKASSRLETSSAADADADVDDNTPGSSSSANDTVAVVEVVASGAAASTTTAMTSKATQSNDTTSNSTNSSNTNGNKNNNNNANPSPPPPPPQQQEPPPQSLPSISPPHLKLHNLVSISRRMWAGINSPGGLGRITKLHTRIVPHPNPNNPGEFATEVVLVDVKYLSNELKSRDRGIPLEFVSEHNPEREFGRRRKRESRRCTNCGSFATDCGDCDWRLEREREEEERVRLEVEVEMERWRLLKGEERDKRKEREREEMSGLEDTSSESSEESDEGGESGDGSGDESKDVDSEEEERREAKRLDKCRRRNGQVTLRRRLRMKRKKEHKKKKKKDKNDNDSKATNNNAAAATESSESDEDPDEVPLAIVAKRKRKAERERERKLQELNLMVSGRDGELFKKQKKKKKKRTRQTCPLGSLPATSGDAGAGDKEAVGSEEAAALSEVTKKGSAQNGKLSVDKLKKRSGPKVKAPSKDHQDKQDYNPDAELMEMDRDNDGQPQEKNEDDGDAVFDFDSDSGTDSNEARERKTKTEEMKTEEARDSANLKTQNEKATDEDEQDETMIETTSDFAEDDDVDDEEERLLTPREPTDSSDDEEEDRPLKDLGKSNEDNDDAAVSAEDEQTENNAAISVSSDSEHDDYSDFDDDIYQVMTEQEYADFVLNHNKNKAEELKATKWGDLPAYITKLSAQIEEKRIKHVENELAKLKRRMLAITTRRRASLSGGEEGAAKELERVFDLCSMLNKEVIKHLHRDGIDLCNRAITRLLSKKERRKNEGKLTDAQEKACRHSTVTVMDLKVANLCDAVVQIDKKVVSFRKEVAKELEALDDNDCGSSIGSIEDDGEGGEGVGEVSRLQQRGKKRSRKEDASEEEDFDPHQHASTRKRNSTSSGKRMPSSSGKKSKTGSRQKRQHVSNTGKATGRSHVAEPSLTSPPGSSPETENQYQTLSTGSDEEMIDADTSYDPDVEFVGETDDLDDHGGSVLPTLSGGGAGRANSRGGIASRQRQRSSNNAMSQTSSSRGDGKGSSHRMEAWLEKQQGSNEDVMESETQSKGSRRRNNAAGRQQSSRPRSRNESSGRSGSQRSVGQGAHTTRGENSSRTPHVRAGNAQTDNIRRQGSVGSKTNSARVRTVVETTSPARPDIPTALSAELLFDSLTHRDVNSTVEEDHEMHSGNNKSLSELCQKLKDCYPTRLQSCHDLLAASTSLVLSKSEGFQKEEIVLLYQTLLLILQGKCTTLLDILQTNPEVASLQLGCWSLLFCTFEKKLNCKLNQGDGTVLHRIFGNGQSSAKILANHILLQVIDVLYSQLMWEEYGQAPRLGDRVFAELRSLCSRIDSVVPILPSVSDLLTRKFGRPRWRKSLTCEQEENQPERVLFVTAIDPGMHKRFIENGELPEPPAQDDLRLKSFGHKIPREEIEAIWSIIGFSSHCTSTPRSSSPDLKPPQRLLAGLVIYDCGTLPKPGDHQLLPPSKLHVDSCSKEIKWICSLLYSKLLGDVPMMDSFVKQIVERAVALEAHDAVLDLLPATTKSRVNMAVKKLWGYSCIVGSSAELESDLQAGLISFDTKIFSDSTNSAYTVMPSSVLLQRCISLVTTYANMVMTKNKRWKDFRTLLQNLASNFAKKAEEVEAKLEEKDAAKGHTRDAFTEMFSSIAEVTEMQIVESPTSSYFREAACYLMLAGVIARSNHNVPGEGNKFHLNKAFRETMWEYSSDVKMRHHQKHLLNRLPGDAPASSSNICLLYISAKTMTCTALLHLNVSDFKSEPYKIVDCLRMHLSAVKVDDDVNMFEYLLTSIISNLLGSCDVLHDLNQRGRIPENEEKCKAHLNSSKSCVDIIRSISMWLTSIFGRAKFIMELLANLHGNYSVELEKVAMAIKKLVEPSFFLFVIQSLTRALSVIINTAERNTFSKALSSEGCLDTSFRSCLGAIRSSIALANTCGPDTNSVVQRGQSGNDWETASNVYVTFVKSQIGFDSTDNGEHRKLCHRQSGGVMSVLAAFCSIRHSRQALSDVFNLFELNRVYNANAADNRFTLQQMGTCFSCELAHLARTSRSCKEIVTQGIEKILSHLLTSLVSSDTLAMFPTCNLSLLFDLDGHNSRSKGNDSLSKAQNHSIGDDPDREAYKIKRMSGEYFDTAGPTHSCKNIWSFCSNVGHVLTHFDDKRYPLQTWPLLRSIGKDIMDKCKELSSDKELLELLPHVSAERECLKRLLIFQALFAALKRDTYNCLGGILGAEGGLYRILSISVIENLYHLSGIELELEDQKRLGCVDPTTKYQRAKALAFQQAYTELGGALFTLMLRESNNWEGTATCNIVRHNLISCAFRGNLDLRRSIEREAVKCNLCLRKKSRKGTPCYMMQDLLFSFFRRTGELFAYGAGSRDKYGRGLFNAMLHGMPLSGGELSVEEERKMNIFVTTVSSRLILTPEAVGVHSSVSSDGLQRAIDNHFLCAEVLRSEVADEQKSMMTLRDWVMDDLFVLLLNCHNTAPHLRILTLKLIACMIKTFSSEDVDSRQKIQDSDGNLAGIATYTKLFHSLKECLCNSIRSSSMDTLFVAEFFSCVRLFLSLPVSFESAGNESTQKESTTLLTRVRALNNTESDSNSSHVAYICEASNWFGVVGKLLCNQASTKNLHDFLVRAFTEKDGGQFRLNASQSNDASMQQMCSSFNLLSILEQSLCLEVASSTQNSNPYAGKSSFISVSGGMNHKFSDESRKAIEDFIHCGVSNTS